MGAQAYEARLDRLLAERGDQLTRATVALAGSRADGEDLHPRWRNCGLSFPSASTITQRQLLFTFRNLISPARRINNAGGYRRLRRAARLLRSRRPLRSSKSFAREKELLKADHAPVTKSATKSAATTTAWSIRWT